MSRHQEDSVEVARITLLNAGRVVRFFECTGHPIRWIRRDSTGVEAKMSSAKTAVPPKTHKKPARSPFTTQKRILLARKPPDQAALSRRPLILIAIALLISGAAALINQVLWIRQLSLVVGVEAYSITIAVSGFFAGLAAGSFALGRIADRWRRPWRLYGILEALTAVTAITVTFALPHAALPFVVLQAHTGPLAWLLPFLLVGTPAFLMGGTLPVMIRCLARTQPPIDRDYRRMGLCREHRRRRCGRSAQHVRLSSLDGNP